MYAKSLQLCPTLRDPIDGSPPGSFVHRNLQARTLEWVAISFSKCTLRGCQEKKKKGKKKYCFFVYMEKQMNRQEKYSEKKFEYRLVLSLTLYLTQDHHKPISFSLFLNFEASSCIHIIFQKYSKVSVKYSNMHPGERNNNTPKKKNIYSAHISSK